MTVTAHRQPRQGHRRRRRPVHEPRPRPARDAGPDHGWGSRRDGHRSPKGFRAAGVTAGLKAPASRTWRSSSTTARSRSPPASSRATASSRLPSSGRGRRSPTAALDAVVLNSGGANACTGPEGFLDTHAHRGARRRGPRRLAAGTSPSAPPASSACGCPWPALLAGIDAAAAALAADGGLDAAHAIMTTDTVPKLTAVSRRRAGASAAWPRAPACSRPGLATMLVRPHHRRGDRPPRRPTPPSATRRASRSTGSTRTAACPPTTPCSCSPRARSASRPTRSEFDVGAHRGLRGARARPHRRRRGRQPRHRDHGRGARASEDAARGRRPRRRPLQPLQGGRLRQRPQLGPRRCPPSAPSRSPSRRSTPAASTSASTASRSAGRAGRRRGPHLVDLTGAREVHVVVDLHAPATAAGHRLDQRPHPRLRPREQRVLHVSASGTASEAPA